METCPKKCYKKSLNIATKKYVKINQSFNIELRKIAPFIAQQPASEQCQIVPLTVQILSTKTLKCNHVYDFAFDTYPS